MSGPYSSWNHAPTHEKRDRPPSRFTASPGEGGSPFFHVAIQIRLSYKEIRGCPLFPFPARGLKLIARSGTVCSITREATNGQPPFCSPLFLAPDQSHRRHALLPVRRERSDQGRASRRIALLGGVEGSRHRTGSLGRVRRRYRPLRVIRLNRCGS